MTNAPDPDIPVAARSGKINSNCTRRTDGKIAPPSLPANPDSDVTPEAIFGGSDGNSDYVRSAKNSPTRLANKPNLEGHINELETMKEVA